LLKVYFDVYQNSIYFRVYKSFSCRKNSSDREFLKHTIYQDSRKISKMKHPLIRKLLKKIPKSFEEIVMWGTISLFAVALPIGYFDFGDNPEYHFNGKIKETRVRFFERWIGIENTLVAEVNGKRYMFRDENNDFIVDYAEIIKRDGAILRTRDRKVIEKEGVQDMFIFYLKEILRVKYEAYEKSRRN